MDSNIFKIFLIAIFMTGVLNFTYANGGPIIGPNQAKHVAQNYLDSNNLSYNAVTPGYDDYQYEATDIFTFKKIWISESKTEDDRYILTDSYPTWIVQVNDKTGKNIGQIYVDDNTAQVLKVVINGKVLKDILNQREKLIMEEEDSYNSTADENLTEPFIDETLSENYDYSPGLIDFTYMMYPIIEISPILFYMNSLIGVVVLIVLISWMFSGIGI